MVLFSKVASVLSGLRTRVMVGVVSSELTPSPVAPPGVEEKVQTVLNWLMWVAGATVIVGFIIGGIMLAISNERGMGNENVRRIGFVIIGAVVIAAGAALAKALA